MSQEEVSGGEYTIGLIAGQMRAMSEQLANIRSDYKAGDEKADKSRANVHRRRLSGPGRNAPVTAMRSAHNKRVDLMCENRSTLTTPDERVRYGLH